MSGLKKFSSDRSMFSIIPLQLATNIFIAETSEDLDRYYGFDTSAPVQLAPPETTPDWLSTNLTEIVELEVRDEPNRFILTEPPPNVQKVIVCDGLDAVQPIQPGDLCIVSQKPKRPMAFFLPPQSNRQDSEEYNAVLELLRGK
jgi:hypothetical protein